MITQKRTLGTSGLEVSAVGLGCMSMTGGYSGHPDRAQMIDVIRAAVDRGADHVDHLSTVGVAAVAAGHTDAPEPDGGHLQPGRAERAFLGNHAIHRMSRTDVVGFPIRARFDEDHPNLELPR